MSLRNNGFSGARGDSANSLKLRLLAALSGVTLTFACAGSSDQSGDPEGSGGSAATGGSTATSGAGGTTGGSAATGTSTATSGAGGTIGGSTATSGAGGTTGGTTALAGSGGSDGKGGTSGSSGSSMIAGGGGSAGVGGTGAGGFGATSGSGGTAHGGGDPGGTGGHSGQVGRPFLVQGDIRSSELELTSTWREQALGTCAASSLDAETRAAVAEHFAHAGLMEHASIAAFARFSLQLLALGAPPELVARATRAMADETRHAQHCFELASRYAGTDLGPGTLDVAGALAPVELLEVVDLVVAEGCIGETAAALEASWAAHAATEPLAREVLHGIADDESRHAALAWEFVAWAAKRDAQVPARVAAQIDAARREISDGSRSARDEPPQSQALAAHGVLVGSARRDARAVVLREILPELVAGLGAGRGRQTPNRYPAMQQ